MQRPFVIITVLLITSASAAFAKEVERSFNHRFEVEAGARLVVAHGDGELKVTPWDEDAIEVDVHYLVRFQRVGLGSDPDLTVRFEEDGKVARVIADESSSGGIGFFSKDEVEHTYRVRAPRYVELEIRGDDGEVDVADWDGAIEIEVDDGSVRLADIRSPQLKVKLQDGELEIDGLTGQLEASLDDGELELSDCVSESVEIRAQDGSVQVERCTGNFEIEMDDGDMELEAITAERLDLTTADGEIEVELAAVQGQLDMRVEGDDGDVSLEIAAGISAAYELASDEGRIEVETASAEKSRYSRRTSGVLGDGSGKIVVSTGGNIHLRQRP